MGWLKDFIFKLLKIEPATERQIMIKEPLSFRATVLRNQIWYRGDPAEMEQFFKAVAVFDTDKARFWASVPQGQIRKMHSGIVAITVDRYRDMITGDLTAVDFGEDEEHHPLADRWGEVAEDCDFNTLLGEAVSGALSSCDGAFKISVDSASEYPIISFYEADRIDIIRTGRRVKEIRFYTEYKDGQKAYNLEETYGIGHVKYRLLDPDGKEVPLDTLEETAGFKDVTFSGSFMMAVPLIIFQSTKWKGRGKALFESKTDALDGLDETISQWMDAIRMGRVKRYIPEDMVPRDPETGVVVKPNPFDNDFIAVGSIKSEGAQDKIDVSQPAINYEAYVNSYASFMDMVLQGIISPATLGIDLKKTDNAEAQREKEKITMHVRGKIIESLNVVIPQLVETAMKVQDLMAGGVPGDYEASVKFGEYASPDFDSTVDAVVKAKTGGVMSIEQSVEELYGDTWTQEEKDEEVRRLKAEQGIAELDETSVGLDGGFITDEGEGGAEGLPDEPAGSEGPAGSGGGTGPEGNLRLEI